MPELHTRLLADVIALGSPYPLVLTGGYAVQAHRLVNRPSQDLDVATGNPAPMADIAATLRAGLEARGWKVHALETAPLSARFTVADPAAGQECEVDILKEIFWRPVACRAWCTGPSQPARGRSTGQSLPGHTGTERLSRHAPPSP